MTPKYAKYVDPIISYVLELLERIDIQGASLDPVHEHSHIKNLIHKADAEFGTVEEWRLANYGLASWADEVLIVAPWKGNTWWVNNKLEWHFHQSNECAVQFYKNASRATQLASRNAVEIYYICVILGFRGLYRERVSTDSQRFSPEAESQRIAFEAEREGLAPTLRAWCEQTQASIRSGGLPPIDPGGGLPAQAFPLEAQSLLIGSILVFALLGAITLITWWTLSS